MSKTNGSSAIMTTAPTREADEDILPTLPPISEDAPVGAARDKESLLRTRGNAAIERRDAIQKKLQELHSDSRIVRSSDLLADNPAADLGAAGRDSLQQELVAATHEVEAIDSALRLVVRQIVQAESEAASRVCKGPSVQRFHLRNNRAVISALLSLIAAQNKQQRLHLQLNAQGYSRTSYLRPNFYVQDFGSLSDPGSWVSALLREAVSDQIISQEEFRQIARGELTQINLSA